MFHSPKPSIESSKYLTELRVSKRWRDVESSVGGLGASAALVVLSTAWLDPTVVVA